MSVESEWGERVFQRFLALDAALVAAGFHATSPWWKQTIRRFLVSGCRQLVLRVGRRGGKSSTLCRLAVCLALFGEHAIPRGDVGIVCFVSVNKDEAAARLRTIREILDVVRFKHRPSPDGGIEVIDCGIVFRTFAATVAAVSGGTCVAVVADEAAKWKDADTGANPAREVLATLRPTMATQPNARMFLSSSPWGVDDAHAQAFDAGDDAFQQVAFAPTWVANPQITEAATHTLEPSPSVRAREYGAQPGEGMASFSTDEIDGITRREPMRLPPIGGVQHIIGVDVGLRRDRTAIVALRKEQRAQPDGTFREVLVVVHIVHLVPGFLRPVTLERVNAALAEVQRDYPGTARADSFMFDAVAPAAREAGNALEQASMAPSATAPRITQLQRHIAAGTLEIPPHPDLRKELLHSVLTHHTGGRITLRAPERAGMHDDIVAALLLAVDPVVANKLPAADLGGGVVVLKRSCWVSIDENGIVATPPKFVRRFADGREEPATPSPDHPRFERWARDLLAQGISNTSIEGWARSRGLRVVWNATAACLDLVPIDASSGDSSARSVSIPIRGND